VAEASQGQIAADAAVAADPEPKGFRRQVVAPAGICGDRRGQLAGLGQVAEGVIPVGLYPEAGESKTLGG